MIQLSFASKSIFLNLSFTFLSLTYATNLTLSPYLTTFESLSLTASIWKVFLNKGCAFFDVVTAYVSSPLIASYILNARTA